MIGKDQRHLVGILDFGKADAGFRPIGTNDQLAGQRLLFLRGLVTIDDHRRALRPLDPHEGAGEIIRPRRGRARAQKRVEILAVDHADIAVLDRDIDLTPGRRDHARGVHLRQQLIFGDVEVLHQRRRDRAATGLDAPFPVQKRHTVTRSHQIQRGRGTRWTTSNNDDIIHDHSPGIMAGRCCVSALGEVSRSASPAAKRKTSPSKANTDP